VSNNSHSCRSTTSHLVGHHLRRRRSLPVRSAPPRSRRCRERRTRWCTRPPPAPLPQLPAARQRQQPRLRCRRRACMLQAGQQMQAQQRFQQRPHPPSSQIWRPSAAHQGRSSEQPAAARRGGRGTWAPIWPPTWWSSAPCHCGLCARRQARAHRTTRLLCGAQMWHAPCAAHVCQRAAISPVMQYKRLSSGRESRLEDWLAPLRLCK
jgi:hypothetical protein